MARVDGKPAAPDRKENAMSPITLASISFEALRHALIVCERTARDHPSICALAIAAIAMLRDGLKKAGL